MKALGGGFSRMFGILETMKRIYASFIVMSLLAFTYAGELADLHSQLGTAAKAGKDSSATGFATLGYAGNITSIGIERTRCYAGCPAYTFIVEKDGTFRYEGSYGVERMGVYTGKISVGRLNQLLAFIDETEFFSFENSYRAAFLDGPTVYTLVKAGDETKVIENYAGTGPSTLWAIEQLMDGLMETATWNPGGNEY